jgi:AraC-like DNA-binding protein
MLMYFNRGIRNFPRHPTKEISLRYNWEFYAVLSGRAAPFFTESEKMEPLAATLWLVAPRRRYAWWSDSKKADRIVFHFSNINESLLMLMEGREVLSVELDSAAIASLIRIANETESHFRNLNMVSSHYFNKAQAELSLMIAERHESRTPLCTLNTKSQVVAREALAFFQSQLPRRPLVDEVAAAVNVSSTHLRRIFLEVFKESPKHLFLSAQLKHAKQLAANSDFLIEEIAVRCGFKGASDFCRAFRRHNQTTFHQWRTEIVDLKKRPTFSSLLTETAFDPAEPAVLVT